MLFSVFYENKKQNKWKSTFYYEILVFGENEIHGFPRKLSQKRSVKINNKKIYSLKKNYKKQEKNKLYSFVKN